MTGKTFVVALSVTFLSSAFTFFAATPWQVREDAYSIKFDTKGATGIIKGLKGTVAFDAANLPASTFAVSVEVNTLNTGNGLKNKHAKSADFFDAEHFPLIEYSSSKVEKTAAGFQSTGRLTIKGISKEVMIPFTFEGTASEGVFKGHFAVSREDFQLKRSGVGEVVQVELVIPVKKA